MLLFSISQNMNSTWFEYATDINAVSVVDDSASDIYTTIYAIIGNAKVMMDIIEFSLIISLHSLIIVAISKHLYAIAAMHLILSLSIADLLIGIGKFLGSIIELYHYILGCVVRETIDLLGTLNTFACVFIIALDRFLSVMWPAHHIKYMNTKQVKFTVAISWGFVYHWSWVQFPMW